HLFNLLDGSDLRLNAIYDCELRAAWSELFQGSNILLELRSEQHAQTPRLQLVFRQRLLELGESRRRKHEAPEHPRVLAAKIARVVRDRRLHIDRRGRKQARVVDQIGKQHAQRFGWLRHVSALEVLLQALPALE